MNIISFINKWQDSRTPWLLMSFVSLGLVIVAHSLFQNFVFMAPCEQCVYIRFAFFCMCFGGIIASISPRILVFKIVGYVLAFYGIIRGILYCVKLNAIHTAAHGDDPFGVQGCSTEPTFPFGLPLDVWWPEWFKPTGDCGYDNPIVPDGVVLEGLQKTLVEFYADGWYLIPSSHFMNMAQACLLAFVICGIILSTMAISFVICRIKK